MSAPEDTQQPYPSVGQPPMQPSAPQSPHPPAQVQPSAQQPVAQAQYPQAQYPQQQYGQLAYGQPQYPQQPMYGQPVYVAPYVYTPSPPRGLSIASMVIGLVSLFFGFTFVLPVIGLVLGIMGARKEPAGRAMAVTGIVLNGVFVLVWAALVLLWVFVIGGLFVGSAVSTGISA
ncbi:DUF4190 domain-containing protein [Plantibacter flavus]|uniref:DUF4190 domain-containing protein n=1 Tax=Plantibacter flavus TaxID=150123 RepID=UPI003F1902EA